MEEYTVKLTAEASKDMEQIYDYIAWSLLAPESALNQYNRIAEAVLSLNQMPERFLCSIVNLNIHAAYIK